MIRGKVNIRLYAGFCILLLVSGTLEGQDVPKHFDNWNDDIIAMAHTANDTEYLSEDEKMVILYANLARADGPLFAETFLTAYLRLKEMKPTRYTRSLFSDLKKVKGLPMMIPERDLYNAAREHAIWSGKKGYEGHKGFKNRFDPLMEKYMEVGENIYYGDYTPLEIVIQLLIDEGITDLGHRVNLLNPRFNSIGVSIRPHKDYEYNCVMGFGRIPRTYKDYIER
jgi:hypothetical protein